MIHSVTAMLAINQAKKRKALARRCPECRNEQAGDENKSNEPVVCENCGQEIPPKAAAKQKPKEKRKEKPAK